MGGAISFSRPPSRSRCASAAVAIAGRGHAPLSQKAMRPVSQSKTSTRTGAARNSRVSVNSGTAVRMKPMAAASAHPMSSSCACQTNGPSGTSGNGQPKVRYAPHSAINPAAERMASAKNGRKGHSHSGWASDHGGMRRCVRGGAGAGGDAGFCISAGSGRLERVFCIASR